MPALPISIARVIGPWPRHSNRLHLLLRTSFPGRRLEPVSASTPLWRWDSEPVLWPSRIPCEPEVLRPSANKFLPALSEKCRTSDRSSTLTGTAPRPHCSGRQTAAFLRRNRADWVHWAEG